MSEFLLVVGWALGAAIVVGSVAALVLRPLRRLSLVVQIIFVAVSSIAALVAGMFVAADQMYLSAHDFTVFLWVAVVAGTVSTGLAAALGRSLIGNSRALLQQVRAVGSEEASASPIAPAANEFAVLARELADSDARLRRSRQREARAEAARRELVAWISHDLRTPLAGLRAMTEALQDGVVVDEPRYHGQMAVQVERLGSMIDDLFQLSTIHSGALRLTLRTVSSAELLSDIVTELEPVAAGRGVRLVVSDARDVSLEADADELTRAVANLVMNSIRLSAPNTEIVLSATPDPTGDFGVLSVSDSAGGIDETDLGRVFEPGWQANTARTQGVGTTTSGAGLGLAIVNGIVTAHRGRVTVRNIEGGCRFDVFVPASLVE
nr:HAMP domain-containing sensor histidine kinase [Frondihabitans sp. VKM Ac-2883]